MSLPELTLIDKNRIEVAALRSGAAKIGREPENEVQVDAVEVSRQHGEFSAVGSQWIYRDLESTNGSWLNGEKLSPHLPRILRHGDQLRLADLELKIFLNPQNSTAGEILLSVFREGEFLAEVPLRGPDGMVTFGGPHHSFPLGDTEALSISLLGPRAVLRTSNEAQVILNASRIHGERTLADRDAIGAAPYFVLVSDFGGRREDRPGANSSMVTTSPVISSSETVAAPPGSDVFSRLGAASGADADTGGRDSGLVDSGELSSTRGDLRYDDWSTAAGKKKTEGRNYVFGMKSEDQQPDSETVIRRSSFEMNISQRVPTVEVQEVDPETKRFRMLIYALVVILALALVGLLVFLIQVLS